MSNLIAIVVVLALLVFFPAFLFIMLVRAIRNQGTRWWGIVILLSLLTCYCTTVAAIIGLIVGGNATGSVALERRYCEQFREVLTQTETLPEAIARMDAAAASDEYQIREPDKNLRFRYVWILGGCFLFAGANLMMFGPGRRERRHPTDCLVMIVSALVVFLTGVWQIAWGNGYAFQASSYRRMLTGWHEKIDLEAIRAPNAEIVAKLPETEVKSLNGLWRAFRELSGEIIPGQPNRKPGSAEMPGGAESDSTEMPGNEESGDAATDDGSKKPGSVTSSGIAIIGGADGPTAVFIGSELLKKQADAPAESEEKANSPANEAEEEDNAAD